MEPLVSSTELSSQLRFEAEKAISRGACCQSYWHESIKTAVKIFGCFYSRFLMDSLLSREIQVTFVKEMQIVSLHAHFANLVNNSLCERHAWSHLSVELSLFSWFIVTLLNTAFFLIGMHFMLLSWNLFDFHISNFILLLLLVMEASLSSRRLINPFTSRNLQLGDNGGGYWPSCWLGEDQCAENCTFLFLHWHDSILINAACYMFSMGINLQC